MSSLSNRFIGVEEYLSEERRVEAKREYLDGVGRALASASERHNLIVANLIIALGARLADRPCHVCPSDLKIGTPDLRRFFYPNVSVILNTLDSDAPRNLREHDTLSTSSAVDGLVTTR